MVSVTDILASSAIRMFRATVSKARFPVTRSYTSSFQPYSVIWISAGLCSRKIDGVVQDLPWKKTFITKSKANQRDIVPIWFSGRNSWRFYFLDKLRNLLKLKLNIAMLTLPDELYRSQHKSYTMVIGKPIPWQTFTSEKKDIEWAAWVREQVYKLKK